MVHISQCSIVRSKHMVFSRNFGEKVVVELLALSISSHESSIMTRIFIQCFEGEVHSRKIKCIPLYME